MLAAATFIFSLAQLAQDAGAVAEPQTETQSEPEATPTAPYDPSVSRPEAKANAAAKGVPRHPVPQHPHSSVVEEDEEPTKQRASEGRRLAVIANTKLQILLTPGVTFVGDNGGVFLGIRAGFGFDLGSVLFVPGVRLAGYFTDPAAYVGQPVVKLVLPLGRLAPFVEAGAGIGHVTPPAHTAASLFAGGGVMVHFSERFGLGAGASYEVITSTKFSALGFGPLFGFTL